MITILVATTENGNLFYLTQPYSKKELASVRKRMQFFCPTCGTLVILKIGEVKTPHFAHTTLSHCDSYSEPESSLHLQGKALLYKFFSSHHFTVELEKYLPAIRQRADLVVNQHTAIEFQCSSLSASQIASRSLGYARIGMPVVWIGGISGPLAEGIQQLKLTHWKRGMLQRQQKSVYILLFSPEENRFYYISNLLYISGSQWIGKVKSLDASKQQFPFAVPKQMTETEFGLMYSLFYQARKKFITSQYYAKNRMQNSFWRACYELEIDMQNLPEAIGVPMKHAELIACNAVLWQLQAIEAAKKGISAASLIQSGKLPLHQETRAKETESLIESYLKLYDKLKEQQIGNRSKESLLYDFYCKTL